MAIELDASASRAASDKTEENDRIPLSLSSEEPVERWFGEEILDHGTGAVDLSRAADGLPLLLDHSTREHIGVIEDVSLDGKRLRGLMRFSKSAKGQEIRADVLDGIRKHASIGYRVRELVLEKSDKKTGTDTYRVTSWTPLEGSLVAVPADHTVGVSRGADEGAAFPVVVRSPATNETAPKAKEHSVKTEVTAPGNGADPNAGAASPGVVQVRDLGNGGNAAPDTRAADLAALAKQYGATDRLGGWITSGATADQARGELLEAIAKNAKPMLQPVVQLTDREQQRYSLRRLIWAMAARALGEKYEDDGFEREVASEIEKNLPANARRNGGLFVPTNIRNLSKFAGAAAPRATRAGLDSATATKGAEVKFTEAGEFIEMLRARMKVFALGARQLSGLVGPVAFPKQTGAGTFAMVGENPGGDVAESNLLLGQVALNPKTGMSTTSFSKQLVAQAVEDVEQLVREDLAIIHALGIDSQAIKGDGTGNNATGVLSTAGIGSVAIGANGGAPTYEHIVDLETSIANANADVETMGYLSTPGIRGKLKKTQQFAGTNGTSVWQRENGKDDLVGYRAEVSTQVPSDLVKGASGAICHAIIFGDWRQLVIGEWGALEILVDPYRLKKQAMIEVTSFQMFGIAVRQAAAFAAVKDATI